MKNHPFSKSMKPIAHAIGCALALSTVNVFAAEAPDDESADANSNKVIITGTRIRVDQQNDTIPVDVILAEDAIDRGLTSVGELLRQSTLASGSAQVTSATSTAFVQNGGTGVETLNLRGLGANRTLVLMNGRRAGPAGTRGSVSAFDFNTIPLSAVERIEILKDGASSLYGSDAVAGVVNIILKEEDGGTIEGFTSQPQESGGERSRISGSWGQSFDNGSFRITFDYDKQSELANGDRDFFACGERYYFDASTGERADIIDPRTGQPHCTDLLWGHVWLYDYGASNLVDANGVARNLAQFDYDGDLGNYTDAPNPQGPADFSAPPGWFAVNSLSPVVNADHPFQDLESHVPESTRATVLLSGDLDLSDSMRAYTEILLNRRETDVNDYRQYWGYIYNENFFAGNPLSAGWTGSQWFSPTPITDWNGESTTIDYRRFVLGLEGQLGEWFWDVSVQSSKSDAEYTLQQIYNDSITDQNWLSGSCVGTNTSVRGVPCIDIPWLDPEFLRGNVSQEMRNFLFGTETGTTIYEQDTVEATITGDILEMPHGALAGAFGIQYQHDSIEDTPGEITLTGNGWGSSSADVTKGAIESYAVFGEVQIPLLENLQTRISARYTDVPDAGSDLTYKLGLAWNIMDDLTFRGSHGTSFRAPGLFELFLRNETSFPAQRTVDPCFNWAQNLSLGNITQTMADNCQAEGIPNDNTPAISATAIRGGGFGVLESETSESNVWGLVWRPEGKNMSISLDYFDYFIEDEISILGSSNILSGCYDSSDFPNDPLCSQFTRQVGPDYRILTINDQYINIAEQKNRGWDFKFDYSTSLPWGELTFRTEHTYQKKSSRKLFESSPEVDFNGDFGEPKHTANALIQFDRDNWYVSWFTQYLAKTSSNVRDPAPQEFITFQGNQVRRIVNLGSTSYHTLAFGYDFTDLGLETVIGVRNVFDKEPPRLSRGNGTRRGNSAFYSQYDWFGRTVFANLRYKF